MATAAEHQPIPPRALAAVLFAVVVWGASFVATKQALREVSPATLVWLRFGLGTAVLAVAAGLRGQLAAVGRRDLAYFAFLGFLGITFHQWLQVTGLVTARATTSAWIVTAAPIFTALLGVTVLRERLGWLRVAGIGLAAAGVLLVVSQGEWRRLAAGRFGTLGDFLVLLSAINWAVFTVLSRRSLESHPATRMTLYVMGFGWLGSGFWLFGAGPGLAEIPHLSAPGWEAVAFLGICCSGLAYIGWYGALQVVPASRLSAFLYLEPPVTTALAIALGQERLSVASLLGGAVIILGVTLVNRRARPGG